MNLLQATPRIVTSRSSVRRKPVLPGGTQSAGRVPSRGIFSRDLLREIYWWLSRIKRHITSVFRLAVLFSHPAPVHVSAATPTSLRIYGPLSPSLSLYLPLSRTFAGAFACELPKTVSMQKENRRTSVRVSIWSTRRSLLHCIETRKTVTCKRKKDTRCGV